MNMNSIATNVKSGANPLDIIDFINRIQDLKNSVISYYSYITVEKKIIIYHHQNSRNSVVFL